MNSTLLSYISPDSEPAAAVFNEQYTALRNGRAFLPMPWLGVMHVTGDDRDRFLQGMVTARISAGQTKTPPSTSCALSVKGKVVAEAYLRRRRDQIDIITYRHRIHDLCNHLDGHIIADDAEIVVDDSAVVTAVFGEVNRTVGDTDTARVPLLRRASYIPRTYRFRGSHSPLTTGHYRSVADPS